MRKQRRGGRPSRFQSEQIQDQILDIATPLFLAEGYGVTSIEKIAEKCGMSKRTFYHRFENKKELFSAVVHRLIERLRPQQMQPLFENDSLEAILVRLADIVLDAALAPEALALHRLLIAEAARFPELNAIMEGEGSRSEGITRIAQLLENEARAGRVEFSDARFAAEQFLQMLIGVPQRRALNAKASMTAAELARWKADTVSLFLNGCRKR